jgi:hypothetical protein
MKVKILILLLTSSANCDRDANTHLNSKNVVRGSAELPISADIAVQIHMVELAKILEKMFPHPVEGELIHETVI